uniref:RRM domain-containing protein n=1 Tax=Meleagris gallopavo TaxID=9103 RepID=A0A803XTE6_MELGA
MLRDFELQHCFVDRHSGTASITLSDAAAAERALQRLQRCTLRRHRLHAEVQPCSALLCVAHLPRQCSQQPWEALVRPYGAVGRCWLVHSRASGRCKGYGFVEYFARGGGRRGARRAAGPGAGCTSAVRALVRRRRGADGGGGFAHQLFVRGGAAQGLRGRRGAPEGLLGGVRPQILSGMGGEGGLWGNGVLPWGYGGGEGLRGSFWGCATPNSVRYGGGRGYGLGGKGMGSGFGGWEGGWGMNWEGCIAMGIWGWRGVQTLVFGGGLWVFGADVGFYGPHAPQLAYGADGQPLGFAVLEYDSADAAERVQAAMDGALVGGSRVCVSFCAPGLPAHKMLPALVAVRTAVRPCRRVSTAPWGGVGMGLRWAPRWGIPTEFGVFLLLASKILLMALLGVSGAGNGAPMGHKR